MFGFLKKKIQEAVNAITKKAKVEDEREEKIEDDFKKEEVKIEEKTKEKEIIEKKEETRKKEEEHKKEKITHLKRDEKEEKIVKKEEKQIIQEEEGKKQKIIHQQLDEEKKEQKPKKELGKKKVIEEVNKSLEKKEVYEKEEKIEESEKQEEKKGFFQKIADAFTHITLSEEKFNELFWDLEIVLLENNVAVEVIEKIRDDLKNELVNKKIPKNSLEKKITETLKDSLEELFVKKLDLLNLIKSKKPFIILFLGVNGTGKTTTIAKIAHYLKKHNYEPVIAACDTFRAAAIQQLEEHANNLNVKLIKHDYGSDPAAVAFDAIEHAKSRNKDVVLIDTAGRLHSNKNLMAELEKVVRISKPDLKIFVGESIAGNDVVEQVKLFNEKIGIDAIVLSKADVDEKGGAAISVSYVTGKPILYLGVGQNYEDLIEFDKEKILAHIFS